MKLLALRSRPPGRESWLPPGRALDRLRPWARTAAELARRGLPKTPAEPLPLRDSLIEQLAEDVHLLREIASERIAPIDLRRSGTLGEIEELRAVASFPNPMVERQTRHQELAAAARLADLDTARAQVHTALVEQVRQRVQRAAVVDAAWRAANERHRDQPLTLEPTPLEVLDAWLVPIPDPLAHRL